MKSGISLHNAWEILLYSYLEAKKKKKNGICLALICLVIYLKLRLLSCI